MSIYHHSVSQFAKLLENLDRWLTAAEEFAKKKTFDPNSLLTARLAPDQFALLRQVQSACDHAKFSAARLSGKTPPAHPDTDQTIAELRTHIRSIVEYLRTFSPADFEGAKTREIALQFMPGKAIRGGDYLVELGLPNFYFHLNVAYAILRHNGVELGKRDYLGALPLYDIPTAKN